MELEFVDVPYKIVKLKLAKNFNYILESGKYK
jgi:hypothetical protein